MKLLTKEIKRKLPELYETESIPLEEKEVVCKFFNPIGAGTWYVIEGEDQGDDFIFFGLIHHHEKEFSYFSLKELQSLRLPFGFTIERVIQFQKVKLCKIECYRQFIPTKKSIKG